MNRYIAYAKTLKPVMSEAASREIALAYVGMRKANGGSAKTIAATTRQLESLIRLSEAHARMRYPPREPFYTVGFLMLSKLKIPLRHVVLSRMPFFLLPSIH